MKKGCNVLILGGNGFIGKNTGKYLADRNYHVTSFDLRVPDEADPRITYLSGDFFRDETLERIVPGQDVIIHALSTINPGNSNESYMRGYSCDFLQTVKLFDMACKQGIKVLFLSSAGTVYGMYEGEPFREDHQLRPINHYGSIKVCTETVMRAFNEQQKGMLISCRITNPYGPGQDYQRGVGFIDAVIKNIMNKTTLEIWGDGNVIRDYIYIMDVCAMIEKLIEYHGELRVFNFSTGTGHSQLEIINIFEKMGYKVQTRFLPARPVDVRISIASNERIKRETGIECAPLEEGIKDYLSTLGI